jgi:2-C-methyl-D-erythritol 2,4-cyclodiphosphate synthase
MRENLATVCKLEISQVSVKATTEEKLGFTGEGLGISAYAVCMLNNNF